MNQWARILVMFMLLVMLITVLNGCTVPKMEIDYAEAMCVKNDGFKSITPNFRDNGFTLKCNNGMTQSFYLNSDYKAGEGK